MHTIYAEVNHEHYHIDLVFKQLQKSFNAIPGCEESNLLKWYNKED
ncbi:hypothetical protein [Clostridium tunisiense]|nr:hypothetical protein [Clostridium tunisiense]